MSNSAALWKPVQQFFESLNRVTRWPSNSTAKHNPREMKISHKNLCTVFRAVLFRTGKTWKQLDEW